MLCRTGRVKKCGEKINEEEEVSSLRLRASKKKEKFLLIFRSRKQVLSCTPLPRRGGKKDERFFNSDENLRRKKAHTKRP